MATIPIEKWVRLKFDYILDDEQGECEVHMDGKRYAFTTIGFAKHPITDPRLRYFYTLYLGVIRLFDMIPTPKFEYELTIETHSHEVKKYLIDNSPCPTVALQMLMQCLSELTNRFGKLQVKTLRD